MAKRPTRRQSQRRDLSRIVLTHAPRQLPSWLIFDVGQKQSMTTNIEGSMPMAVMKQPSAEPLDCSVWQMRVEEKRFVGARVSDRAAAPMSRCHQRAVHVQRRDLVRQAKLLRKFSMRGLHPRKLFGQASDFAHSEWPNKAPEPTPGPVTGHAVACPAPVPVVAHL